MMVIMVSLISVSSATHVPQNLLPTCPPALGISSRGAGQLPGCTHRVVALN